MMDFMLKNDGFCAAVHDGEHRRGVRGVGGRVSREETAGLGLAEGHGTVPPAGRELCLPWLAARVYRGQEAQAHGGAMREKVYKSGDGRNVGGTVFM